MQHAVLVVDDEPDVRDMLTQALSREPYEVLCADSAEEALDIIAREPVDVVLSDEKMPGMSGTEFLAIVRRQYPDTIRMILTGHASLESAIHAINEGEIYRFFTKPCNMVDLMVTIRQALKHKDLIISPDDLTEILDFAHEAMEEGKILVNVTDNIGYYLFEIK